MIAVRILVCNYHLRRGLVKTPNEDKIFDTTIWEAEELYQQFSELPADSRGDVVPPTHEYQFLFSQDGRPLKGYIGYDNKGTWIVRDMPSGAQANVDNPLAILQGLHESIGLPVYRAY